jgi:signal peptidase I
MASRTSKKQRSPLYSFVELIATIAVAVGVAFLIQAFVVKPYRIPSGSMEPTLHIGQRILAYRLATHPGVGDIVVFHPPGGADPQPAICGNSNQGGTSGQACDAPTRTASSQTFIKRVVGVAGDHLRIVNGHVYRNGAREPDAYIAPCDAQAGGQGCNFRKTIVVPAGDYYMMGDNRGESDDSRYWGPVPQKWIIGEAFFTYWPPDRIGTL